MRRTLEKVNYGGFAAAGRAEQARLAAALPKAPPMEYAQIVDMSPASKNIMDPVRNYQLPQKIVTEKGSCPKCGRHIGRGIHFHLKKCNG